jgi:argininosuccinate synthase
MSKKVVLAYSGGLDTSCCVAWLRERGYEVVCFSANLGSEFSPAELRKKAKQSGISNIYIKDLRKEFARDYIIPSLLAGAVYQEKYLLSTALGRPLIAKYLVEVAENEGAAFVAHGCTAKGNDQVRLDVGVKSLNSRLKIIAPLREWALTSRDSEIEYAKKNKIPIEATSEKIYSIDKNIWGVSIEAGILEDLNNEPKEDPYIFTQSLEKAPNKPEYVCITFNKGKPVALNGKKLEFISLIEALNAIGGKHCIGRTDLIEDRMIGIKSREVYEAPAAWILHTAHRELEALTLDKEALYFKDIVSLKYAQLVYQGLWFTPLKNSLDAFVRETQKFVSGEITLKLYKGNCLIAKRFSKNALYKKTLATYGENDSFNREWSQGFINIWSMPFVKR